MKNTISEITVKDCTLNRMIDGEKEKKQLVRTQNDLEDKLKLSNTKLASQEEKDSGSN